MGDFDFEASLVDAGHSSFDRLTDLEIPPVGLLDRTGNAEDEQALGIEAFDQEFRVGSDRRL
jgi:hypothetical protein